MRKVDSIVTHYSATRADRTLTVFDLGMPRRRRGFNGTGYHYHVCKDGTTFPTCPIERIGVHAKGSSTSSIGICYKGGLDCRGRPVDTRMPEQRVALRPLVHQLKQRFPGYRVCGRRDLSPDLSGGGEIESKG